MGRWGGEEVRNQALHSSPPYLLTSSPPHLPTSSPLVQVLLDLLRLPQERRDVLVGRVREPRQHPRGLLELLLELRVLLVPPGLPQGLHLGQQQPHLVAD